MIKDLTGQVFGRLEVQALSHTSKNRQTAWLCVCSCGNTATIRRDALVGGTTLSCGCLHLENINKNPPRLTHGYRHTPEYAAYCDAKTRCTNPRKCNYKNYGGRGIQFKFTSFEEFLACIGHRPPGYSLDRYPDNDGNYEPGNVRWATGVKQRSNRRDSQRR